MCTLINSTLTATLEQRIICTSMSKESHKYKIKYNQNHVKSYIKFVSESSGITVAIKGALPGLRIFLAIESPLKMIKCFFNE